MTDRNVMKIVDLIDSLNMVRYQMLRQLCLLAVITAKLRESANHLRSSVSEPENEDEITQTTANPTVLDQHSLEAHGYYGAFKKCTKSHR